MKISNRALQDSTAYVIAALSFAASSEDPASGGRHKVWGSKPLWVLPQTSTIASHLPKAFGTAIAIDSSIVVSASISVGSMRSPTSAVITAVRPSCTASAAATPTPCSRAAPTA